MSSPIRKPRIVTLITPKSPSRKPRNVKKYRTDPLTQKEKSDVNDVCEFITQQHLDIGSKVYKDIISEKRNQIKNMAGSDKEIAKKMIKSFIRARFAAVCMDVETMKIYGKGNFESYMRNENAGDWRTGRNIDHYVRVWNLVFPSKRRPRTLSDEYVDIEYREGEI
jgi:hypothetical protein